MAEKEKSLIERRRERLLQAKLGSDPKEILKRARRSGVSVVVHSGEGVIGRSRKSA